MTRLPTYRPPTHPGEMLMEEFLTPLGVSQSAFARAIGVSFPRMTEIVHGKRPVTTDTALRLEQVLGMPAGFWLGLQLDWDLWHAKHSDAAKSIATLQPLTRSSGERLIEGTREVVEVERVSSTKLGRYLRQARAATQDRNSEKDHKSASHKQARSRVRKA